jgi:hypothetical protein
MCGIAGKLSSTAPVERSLLERMRGRISDAGA